MSSRKGKNSDVMPLPMLDSTESKWVFYAIKWSRVIHSCTCGSTYGKSGCRILDKISEMCFNWLIILSNNTVLPCSCTADTNILLGSFRPYLR